MYARTYKRKTRRTTRAKAPAAPRTRRYTKRNPRKGRTTRKPAGAFGGFLGLARPSIQRGYLPFNSSYMARLPFALDSYITASNENATNGVAVTRDTFRLNGAFDPIVQLGGRFPLQFDLLAERYNAYTVYGCKVDITFYNPTEDGVNVGCRLRLNTTGSVATSGLIITDLREQPNTIIRQLNNTGSQKTHFSFYVRPRDILGVTHTQYQDGFYSAGTTSLPAAPAVLLEPFIVSTTAGSGASVRFSLRLTYYIKFYDPDLSFDPTPPPN